MNETWLTVHEVTDIKKITERTFYRRFKLGHYPAHKYVFSSSGGRGGRQLLIALSSLPPSAQVQYMQSRSEGSPHAATKALLTPRVRTIMKFSTAAAWNQEIALARAELISLIGLKSGKAKKHKTKRTTLAVEAYNDHVIKADVTLPSGEMKDIYSLLGKVSVKTLYKWKKAFAQDGLDGLLTSYHGRQEVLSEELKKEIMALLFERKRNARKIYEYLKIKFPNSKLPTYETINRHVKTLRAQYAEELMYIHEGERKWKSKYQLSLGDAAGDCAEPNEKWEIDTTPADIITKEGTRWKLIALIDVYSRRVKVRLFETSNAWGIAQTLRAGFLDFGIPKKLIKDNGLDYQSKLVNQICNDLAIEIPKLPPYAPEKKPHIERFFRTLSESLFSELTGYTGNCLVNRPEIIIKHYHAPELQELIDRWVANIYEETVHRGIECRPREAYQKSGFCPRKIDERELDLLLMPTVTRTVRKCRIEYNTLNFYSPVLTDYNGKKVDIRIDQNEASTIYVFYENEYICTAKDMLALNLTPSDIEKEKRRQKKALRDFARSQRELSQTPVIDQRLHDLLEAKAESKPLVFPQKEQTVSLETFHDALEKIADEIVITEPAHTQSPDPDERPFFLDERERYEWNLKRRGLGYEIDPDEQEAMKKFEEGTTYELCENFYRRYEESFRERRVSAV